MAFVLLAGTAFVVAFLLGYLFCRWWLLLIWIVASALAITVIPAMTSTCRNGSELCVVTGIAILAAVIPSLVGLVIGIATRWLIWQRRRLAIRQS